MPYLRRIVNNTATCDIKLVSAACRRCSAVLCLDYHAVKICGQTSSSVVELFHNTDAGTTSPCLVFWVH